MNTLHRSSIDRHSAATVNCNRAAASDGAIGRRENAKIGDGFGRSIW
ncbi:hypothetical protein NX02_28135 [Sphingomonas sanxanigenens DSM 19645 = NX02]|uniref:Uncharacterized protein n=1 Tax=Sphingomonas sanxanigenens DSM 19645 = NX02 TaxID=1123269 RepID=W0AH30_9SPHN|nr:hypothetical protein NX02_28135 [Sphingomonas sanxanigenens DSM 19645 = NX02]